MINSASNALKIFKTRKKFLKKQIEGITPLESFEGDLSPTPYLAETLSLGYIQNHVKFLHIQCNQASVFAFFMSSVANVTLHNKLSCCLCTFLIPLPVYPAASLVLHTDTFFLHLALKTSIDDEESLF
jgi:hypothetical protein